MGYEVDIYYKDGMLAERNSILNPRVYPPTVRVTKVIIDNIDFEDEYYVDIMIGEECVYKMKTLPEESNPVDYEVVV
jgi:hypothetical protein